MVTSWRACPDQAPLGSARTATGRQVGTISSGILFTGGSVFDGTGFLEQGTRVLVTDGKISAVGPDVEPGTAEIVELDGGTLLPGFIDAHAHPVSGGLQLLGCDLEEGSGSAAYLDIVARYAAANPGLEWITGSGWGLPAFPGGIPTRQALDSVVPGRPVFLYNRDHHGAWANSKALELAGIDRRTPDPADGRIERDADGEPVGMLQEGAMKLVSRLLPEISGEDKYRGLLAAQDYLMSLGVTGWQDASSGPATPPLTTRRMRTCARRRPAHDRGRRRGAVVAAGRGPGAARGTAPVPPAQRGRAIQADQREDDARRNRGEPHRRDARPLPRPRRLRDRELRAGLHRPRRAPPLRDRPRPGGLPGALPRARRPGGPQRAQRRRGGPRGPPWQRQGNLDPAPPRAPASRPPR